MKIFFKCLTLLTIAVCFISVLPIQAASGYSFSVGTKFSNSSGDDSSDEATIAKTKLSEMGYATLLLTIPTLSRMTLKINNSRAWMESDVLYFLGHANSSTIYWDYLGKGGDYAVAIRNEDVGYCDNYWAYTGIGMYNMNYVDLGVFMGCSTASDPTNNLPKYANSRGAKVTIGWTTDIPQQDTYNWTNRFFTKLANGYDVNQAVSYANSFTYSSSAIKSTKIYGFSNITISSSSLPEFETMDESVSSYTLNKKISNVSKDNFKSVIENEIKMNLNVDFNPDDYIIESAINDNGIIYDYYYTVNGIKTNIGYTVFTNYDSTKIIRIVDNMNGINTKSLSNTNTNGIQAKSKRLTSDLVNSMKEKALEISGEINYNTPTKTIIDEYKYYDILENKLYYNIVVEIVDPIPNTKTIEYYMEEI